MPKSMMDWLGVASLWVGTVIMAIKAGDLSLPEGTPAWLSWLSSPWWAIVPLLLVTLSVIILMVRGFQGRKAVLEISRRSTPRRPEKDDGGWWMWLLIPLAPLVVILLITSVRGTVQRIQGPPPPTPPPVLQGSVTAAFVKQTLANPNTAEAEMTLSRYLGTPMRATGRIYSIRGERGFRLHVMGLTDPAQKPQVYLKFEGRQGLSSYNRQDHIAANCKIERLDASGIGLNQCLVIEAPDVEN